MPVNDRTPTPQETQALDEVGAVGLGHLFCCTGRTNPIFSKATTLKADLILLNMATNVYNSTIMLMRSNKESRNRSFS